MEKDTDSKKITLETNGLLPYQEDVIALYKDLDCLSEADPDTVAWTRLGEETLEVLAASGEAQFVSIVPDALEYKLDDYDKDEDLDRPLRDLGFPTGSTRYYSVLEGLAKLGLAIYPAFTKKEHAAIVRDLDSLEAEQFRLKKFPESVGRLVEMAVDQGLSRGKVEEVLDESAEKRGVLVGLSEKFLNDAGDDVWPEGYRGEDNHPSRYAKLKRGLRLEHMTKIVPLDNTSKVILEGLKEHASQYEEELEVRRKLQEGRRLFQTGIENLGLDA